MISDDLTKAEAEDYERFNPEDDNEISVFKKHNYIIAGILITVILFGIVFSFVIHG